MMNTSNWQAPNPGYTTVEMLLDDVAKQMASSNLSRYSRGSGSQKPGASMRIIKPNSASNSPRGSMGLGRRRTVMNDGAYRRRLVMLDQSSVAASGVMLNDGLQVPSRSNRPVSWHPGNHLAPQPVYQSTFPIATPDMNTQYQYFDFPPTPAAYSGYTSPASTFSPLSMPYNGYEQQMYPYQETTTSIPSESYTINHQFVVEQPAQSFVPQPTPNQDPSMYSHFDWNNFAANGFENSTTAPPTPENFLPIQHPEPTFPAEETIPYHPLSDDDDGEEELIGMGLYDSPEPAKTPSSDPQLNNYRAMMMSSLFGTATRRVEPTGKGLKLEETWNPPPSDDEDEDDEDQDGEGDDEDEVEFAEASLNSQAVLPVAHPSYQVQIQPASHNYEHSGWV